MSYRHLCRFVGGYTIPWPGRWGYDLSMLCWIISCMLAGAGELEGLTWRPSVVLGGPRTDTFASSLSGAGDGPSDAFKAAGSSGF